FGDNPPAIGNGFPSSDHRLVWVEVAADTRGDGHGRDDDDGDGRRH
ncbi:MAG: hypothetical protein QOE40_822, partial [Actinomycetota bacterium]|nr:hypothetical protein [Actinomycetota bacterium]